MKRRLGLFALLVVALCAALLSRTSSRVRAQVGTPSDDDVNAIASQLFCPVCENTPLDVCPTEACRQWRDLIRQMLAEGKTAEEIKQYFVENYGIRVLSEPPRTGLNWLVYVLPLVAFLLGATLLFRAFTVWKREAKAADPVASPPPPASKSRRARGADDPYVARLEDELKKRK
jgi:cytochrome c-type biogenesis protein CcmH